MKFSSKVEKSGLSPMRKFHPYAVAAEAKGKKIYHLNIGQPDIETPKQFFDAIKHFEQPVLAYAPSPGMPVLIKAIQKYYDKLNMHFDESEILITTGGSEALCFALQAILDDEDEIVSEELAAIYLSQGLRREAIAIYRKLSLLNPEKSVYFAELIGKIENNIKI